MILLDILFVKTQQIFEVKSSRRPDMIELGEGLIERAAMSG
jgi:hypothetical protein